MNPSSKLATVELFVVMIKSMEVSFCFLKGWKVSKGSGQVEGESKQTMLRGAVKFRIT